MGDKAAAGLGGRASALAVSRLRRGLLRTGGTAAVNSGRLTYTDVGARDLLTHENSWFTLLGTPRSQPQGLSRVVPNTSANLIKIVRPLVLKSGFMYGQYALDQAWLSK